ncbi:hypothetical protein [Stenotrophomonas mori]|uniref:Uncharacterized protein n=1 Tax=Stenotrophomonas mori TaxID=2871096 RepID=A0ABT0SKD8_9GAMM|nr:hypothetical protein [Stenotrophomonas mori]MCL7715803.1 hypothetical protein [Stenotrophomonas mori]
MTDQQVTGAVDEHRSLLVQRHHAVQAVAVEAVEKQRPGLFGTGAFRFMPDPYGRGAPDGTGERACVGRAA